MTNPLLDSVQPAELANRNQRVVFKGEVGEFERLVAVVNTDLATLDEDDRPRNWQKAVVAGQLEFSWMDASGRLPAARGRVGARLAAICQRCLEPFELPVEAPVNILFVSADDEYEQDGTDEFETWELDDETVRVRDIFEESLIMALPLAPAHDTVASCGSLAREIPANEPDTVRPFADLRSQMEKTNK